MSVKVAIEHRTTYRFNRPIHIGPHLIRLRPAPHTRTPIESYALQISPAEHAVHWHTDPFGNHLARVVFFRKAAELEITVGLVADLQPINPFDFLLEGYAERFPFRYPAELAADLGPYLETAAVAGPALEKWLADLPEVSTAGQPTVQFLSTLNRAVSRDIAYSSRMEQGVQTPDQTLAARIGSCRDSGWLLVAALRHLGLAARFVSGYLVQLSGGQAGGPAEDSTDLHAWTEVYLPGAGWIGLDPTSGLYAGEGHIPLAGTPQPASSAPVTGTTERSEATLSYSNSVIRVPPQGWSRG
jgi:transglutaminase-like putative cysteine protease